MKHVIPDFLQEVRCVPSKQDQYKICIDACTSGGLYLEFGVSYGASLLDLRRIVSKNITLYGFDSFKGLPEAWNGNRVGSYASDQRISLPNTVLVEGMFADTIPAFVAEYKDDPVSFMHVDCDLYSATRTVFSGFKNNIVPGTVLLFDEFFGYEGWQDHEAKAFNELIEETGYKYEYLCRDDHYRLGVKITL